MHVCPFPSAKLMLIPFLYSRIFIVLLALYVILFVYFFIWIYEILIAMNFFWQF